MTPAAMLQRWGQHELRCGVSYMAFPFRTCTCGLNAAIADAKAWGRWIAETMTAIAALKLCAHATPQCSEMAAVWSVADEARLLLGRKQ